MGVKYSRGDLDIFSIADFAGRMAAMRAKVRPKLEALGEELAPLLMTNFKQEFFAHTAKHMRRKVNPPDETWVALGPQSEWKGLADYTRRDKNYAPAKIDDLDAFATETGKRLQEVKSALFDVGFEVKAQSSSLAQDVLRAFDRLYPFYECGLREGVKFR